MTAGLVHEHDHATTVGENTSCLNRQCFLDELALRQRKMARRTNRSKSCFVFLQRRIDAKVQLVLCCGHEQKTTKLFVNASRSHALPQSLAGLEIPSLSHRPSVWKIRRGRLELCELARLV